MIHLVDWSKQPAPFQLSIDPASFYGGNRKVRWRLLVPAKYDRAAHERAQASGDFSELVSEAASGEGMVNELLLPALRPGESSCWSLRTRWTDTFGSQQF